MNDLTPLRSAPVSRRSILAGLAGFAAAGMTGLPALAQGASGAASGAAAQKIADHFSSVKTMMGEFVQFGPRGEQTGGKFFIERPGKLRFNFEDPSPIRVIADGNNVVIGNLKLKTWDLYPLSKTPLRFLLADQIDLTSEANVTTVSLEPDLVRVVLEQSTVFGDGKLTMIFDRKSNELRQWTVTDAQGYDTTVALYNITPNQPTDEKLFFIDRTRILK